MVEEEVKKTEEEENEAEEEEPKEKIEQETEDNISKANAAAARLEEANKEHERLLAKEEKLKVETTLSGTTDAGTQTKTKEEKQIANAKDMLKGTGYGEELFPDK